MRLSLIALCALAFTATADAQMWRRVATHPTMQDLDSVHMLTPQRLFVSGRHNTLLRSEDGGATWQNLALSQYAEEPLYRVSFRDANVGFVSGNSGDLFRTTDGGATWNRVQEFYGGSWREMSFPAPDVVFIGGNGAVVRSLDNGVTFEVRSGYPTCPIIFSIGFRDAAVGLVGGIMPTVDEGGIYKTTDGGQTWVRKHPNPANQVIWIDPTTVLALAGGQVVKSTDEGETWTVLASAPPMLTMQRVTPTLFVGVDGLGGIYRSTDGALTWQTVQQPIFDISKTWEVHFSDAQNGFVVGERGSLFRTTNGGATWQQRNNGINMQSANIHAFDDNVLLSAGDIGLVMRSTDGGNWWNVQRIKVTGVIWNRYEDIKAMDIHAPSGLAIACGAGGVIFRSTDRGATWQSVGYPAIQHDPSFHKVHVVSASVAYMLARDPDGGNRNVWKTTDGGVTWTPSQIPMSELYDVEFVDENLRFVVAVDYSQSGPGRFGYYRTANGGATWTFREVATPHSSLHTMEMANANVGYLMGAGFIATTTNGGQTWTQRALGTERLWNTLYVRSATEVYAAESGYENPEPKLWKSTNSGQTWAPVDGGEAPLHLDAVTMTPSGALYVAGFQGGVWTTAAPVLQLTSAVSRKTHGGAGTFDINLPLTGQPAIESRSSGGAHTLVFTFNADVSGGTAQVESGSGSMAGSPVFNGNTMTVQLSSVADAQTVQLRLTDVVGPGNRALAPTTGTFHVLAGDTTRNGVVNTSDIAQTKSQAGQPVTAVNFRSDVVPTGSVTTSDIGFVKSRAGNTINSDKEVGGR